MTEEERDEIKRLKTENDALWRTAPTYVDMRNCLRSIREQIDKMLATVDTPSENRAGSGKAGMSDSEQVSVFIRNVKRVKREGDEFLSIRVSTLSLVVDELERARAMANQPGPLDLETPTVRIDGNHVVMKRDDWVAYQLLVKAVLAEYSSDARDLHQTKTWVRRFMSRATTPGNLPFLESAVAHLIEQLGGRLDEDEEGMA